MFAVARETLVKCTGLVQRAIRAVWNWLGPARSIVLGLGVVVGLVNETWSLCERMLSIGDNKATVTAAPLIVGSDATDIRPAPPLTPPSAVTGTVAKVSAKDRRAVGFLLGQMHDAYTSGNYTNAVEFAHLADWHMRGCATNAFVHERLSTLSVEIEDAFYRRDYKKTLDLISSMKRMSGVFVAETPSYVALRDIAKLLATGTNEMLFLSPVELGWLRTWDKQFLQEYLSYLAAWGYIQPIMLDPRTRNHHTFYYEEFFGFDKPLPYQKRIRICTTNETGNPVESNEASVRWVGRKEFTTVDIDSCIARAMGFHEDEKYNRGLTLGVKVSDNFTKITSWWTVNEGYGVNSNAVCSLQAVPEWKPGMKSPVTELNTVYLSKINERRIGIPYVPRRVWIVMATLICMAFSTPTTREPAAPKGEGCLTANDVAPEQDEEAS